MDDSDTTGYSRQISETRDWTVQPHELAILQDVLLLTPYGFCQAGKFRLHDGEMRPLLLADSKIVRAKVIATVSAETGEIQELPYEVHQSTETTLYNSPKNEGAKIMSIEERTANANSRIAAAEQRKRQEVRAAQETQRRKDSRRNYVIGELVTRYFPLLREYEPGTDAENQTCFEPLESFLYVLSTDYDLVRELQDRATQLTEEDPDGEWRIPV